MADEEARPLVVVLEDEAEHTLEAALERLGEQAGHGSDGAYYGDDALAHGGEVEPSLHHEGNGSHQQAERAQRNPEGLHLAGVGFSGGAVGVGHTLFERGFVSVGRGMGLEEHGTQRRRQRQSVKSRQTDGYGHCQTELAVEDTGRTWHERYGDEHQHHYECNRDDGRADLAHGIDSSLARTLVARVELGVHGFHHHDGVVDHDGDRKHKCRQRDEVHREADKVHEEECAYQGHRDGDGRNQRASDVAEEHVYHEEHKDERLDKRRYYLVD